MLDTNLIKVKVVEENETYGKFEIEPLERGYGQTVGNSIRRVLLSSLAGAAVTAVKLNGAKHEYSTLAGVEEDVLNIILNIKQLRVKMFDSEKETLYLNVNKVGDVKASDIQTTSNVEILNPELVIATLSDSKNSFSMEIIVEKGIGYLNSDTDRNEIGLIPVDADFSPVERVNFSVSAARLGQVTDLDKVTLEVFTKTVKPSVAMYQALDIYTSVLNTIKGHFEAEEEVVEEPVKTAKKTKKEAK